VSKQDKAVLFLPESIRNYHIKTVIDPAHISGHIDKIKMIYRKNRSRLFFISGAAVLMGALLCGLAQNPPDAYIAPRLTADIDNDAGVSFYLTSENDVKDQNIKILSYVDAETEMVSFSGNIASLEWVRGVITGGLLTGVASFLILLYLFSRKDYAKILRE
jgi:hypothetical protein